MPIIRTPQAPIRPTIQATLAWSGGAGSEVLHVVVRDGETLIADYEVDFSGLGLDDEFLGVTLPEGVPDWANVVAWADRAADGTLMVGVPDWARPQASEVLTDPLPWEATP